MITLYHSSPNKITELSKDHEPFNGVLFFSDEPYVMSTSKVTYIYSIDIEESEIIEVISLDCDETVHEIIHLASWLLNITIDEDRAHNILTAHESIFDVLSDMGQHNHFESASDFDWTVQTLQVKAGENMGYSMVLGDDEQGAVWYMNMIGKEDQLNLFDEWN